MGVHCPCLGAPYPTVRPIPLYHGTGGTVHGSPLSLLRGSISHCPSYPTVPWDRWDCPWESTISSLSLLVQDRSVFIRSGSPTPPFHPYQVSCHLAGCMQLPLVSRLSCEHCCPIHSCPSNVLSHVSYSLPLSHPADTSEQGGRPPPITCPPSFHS